MKNLFRKVLVTIIVSLLGLFTAQAASARNFYIGAKAGYLRSIFSTYIHYTDSNKSNNFVDQDEGLAGTMFVGYGQKIHRLYLGAEAEGSLYDAKHTMHLRVDVLNKKIRGSFGASLMPGYYITEHTLLFCNIGLLRGNFMVAKNNEKINRWLTGYYLGVGMSAQLVKRLHLILDYQYNQYDRSTFGFGNELRRMKTDTGTIELGLAYDLT